MFRPFIILLFIFIWIDNYGQSRSEIRMMADSRELHRLEEQWLHAEFALDTGYVSSLMDDSFIAVSDAGIHSKKQSLVAMYEEMSGRLRDSIVIDSFNLEEFHVQLYDNTAVVTFVVHSFGRNKTIATERRTLFYDVWIRKGRDWKAVASQGTRLS